MPEESQMNSKVCSRCQVNRPITEFYLRKTGKRTGNRYEICNYCTRDRARKYYQDHKDVQLRLALLRTKKYLHERRKLLATLKNHPCADCGKVYPPWVMDFDHRENTKKLGSIAYMFLKGMWRKEKLMEEISKCDLVCANCHRQRTYLRGSRNYDKILEVNKPR